ncbi:MAG: GntP family permease [Petrimonas sp.]|nr:GntP family permease [Petrimonas sp.]
MSMLTISLLVLLSIVLIVVLTSWTKLNAFAALFIVALMLAMVTLPGKNVVEILKQGFGSTIASIGFLIIFGAIIAVVLEQSGGAESIANAIFRKTGRKRAAEAMGITGFIVGFPIFCDSGYIIMSQLAKTFSAKAKIVLPLIAFVLATALYSVHCLVPTHPGALAASGIIGANIGLLILLGTLFAIPAAIAAFLWIKWRTKNMKYIEDKEENSEINVIDQQDLPSVTLSLLPIVVPLLLIAVGSLLGLMEFSEGSVFVESLTFIGHPIIALMIGVLLSFLLLKSRKISDLNVVFEKAIEKAGPILIVTGAGGMFGLVIKETGVGAYAGEFLLQTGLGLAVPFLIASILKTAQGSSTVAIITSASFVTPMLPALGLDSETGKLLAMISMGAGSMMVSHANDSYFWVVSRFSGINSNTTLKVYSSATIVMGITTFLCVWSASFFML